MRDKSTQQDQQTISIQFSSKQIQRITLKFWPQLGSPGKGEILPHFTFHQVLSSEGKQYYEVCSGYIQPPGSGTPRCIQYEIEPKM